MQRPIHNVLAFIDGFLPIDTHSANWFKTQPLQVGLQNLEIDQLVFRDHHLPLDPIDQIAFYYQIVV